MRAALGAHRFLSRSVVVAARTRRVHAFCGNRATTGRVVTTGGAVSPGDGIPHRESWLALLGRRPAEAAVAAVEDDMGGADVAEGPKLLARLARGGFGQGRGARRDAQGAVTREAAALFGSPPNTLPGPHAEAGQHYASLALCVRAYLKTGASARARALADTIVSQATTHALRHGPPPPEIVFPFYPLMDACVRRGDVWAAVEVYESLNLMGVAPTRRLIHGLLDACRRARYDPGAHTRHATSRRSFARRVCALAAFAVEAMGRQHGLVADRHTLERVLGVYTAHGDHARAEETREALLGLIENEDEVCTTATVDALLASADSRRTLDATLSRVLGAGYTGSNSFLTSTLFKHGLAWAPLPQVRLWQHEIEAYNEAAGRAIPLQWSAHAHNTKAAALAVHGNFAGATRELALMYDRAQYVSRGTLRTLIAGAPSVKSLHRLWGFLLPDRLLADRRVALAMAVALARGGDAASALDMMHWVSACARRAAPEGSPDVEREVYSLRCTMVHAFAEAGAFESALQVTRLIKSEAVQGQPRMDESVTVGLLKAISTMRHLTDRLDFVVRDMLLERVCPTQRTRRALRQMCARIKRSAGVQDNALIGSSMDGLRDAGILDAPEVQTVLKDSPEMLTDVVVDLYIRGVADMVCNDPFLGEDARVVDAWKALL